MLYRDLTALDRQEFDAYADLLDIVRHEYWRANAESVAGCGVYLTARSVNLPGMRYCCRLRGHDGPHISGLRSDDLIVWR